MSLTCYELWLVQEDGNFCAYSAYFNHSNLTRGELWQRAKPATKREMSQFHTDEYVDFLYRINPDNAAQFAKEQVKCEF